ncbi:MAG: cob(I)yrinic acid a,c-diamide adenosyltransferase, partial [Brooklawnia sp.]|nr:cob(I)yrinic acid a,c-diamide adenosyltransferase [Brooklawnia sp.]
MPAVYTRTGDRGETGLFGGTRVAKQDPRVEAYGTVDEANASLGLAKAGLEPGVWRERVHQIQHRLFVLGAELASDEKGAAILDNKVSADDIDDLERLIDDCLAITGPQRAFVIPGRDPRSAAFHLARTTVRRAERRTLTLAESEAVRPELIKYLNRLSDATYALARLTEHWADLALIEATVRKAVATQLNAAGAQTGVGGQESGDFD